MRLAAFMTALLTGVACGQRAPEAARPFFRTEDGSAGVRAGTFDLAVLAPSLGEMLRIPVAWIQGDVTQVALSASFGRAESAFLELVVAQLVGAGVSVHRYGTPLVGLVLTSPLSGPVELGSRIPPERRRRATPSDSLADEPYTISFGRGGVAAEDFCLAASMQTGQAWYLTPSARGARLGKSVKSVTLKGSELDAFFLGLVKEVPTLAVDRIQLGSDLVTVVRGCSETMATVSSVEEASRKRGSLDVVVARRRVHHIPVDHLRALWESSKPTPRIGESPASVSQAERDSVIRRDGDDVVAVGLNCFVLELLALAEKLDPSAPETRTGD